MATSGYVETNSYSGAYLRLEWTRTSYNSASGLNYVHWVLKGVKNSSGYYLARNFKVTSYNFVSGNTAELYNSSSDIQLYNGTVIAEGDDTFVTNPNGTCRIQFNIEGAIYSYSVNCTGYDSWDLDTVPRYPSGTSLTVTAKTATTVTLKWKANESCSEFQYKIGSGSWVSVPGTGTTTTYTVTGLTPGTSYTFYSDFKRADSGLWSSWNSNTPSATVVTYNVGKITSAPNFDDEANPTIYYTNEAGNTVTSIQACISLTGASADVPYRDISKTGTSYTFNLTTAERNTLRNATTSNSRTVIFYIKTVAGGNTYYSTSSKTLSIVNGNPTFSNYTFEDIGTVSTQLTGDSQIFINNYNNLRVTISTSNKATANKGATMSKYRLVCGNKSTEVAYSSNADIVLGLDYITNRTISVYAIDSRGNSTRVDKTISTSNWKDYSIPIISGASVARTNGVQTDTTLTFSGTFWNSSFGAEANTITECSYKYKKTTESSYGNAVSIVPTISGNNITFSSLIQGDEGADGFNLSNSYDIQITIKDTIGGNLGVAIYNLLLASGSPVMAIHKNGAAFGLPYDTSVGGALQVNGKKFDNAIIDNKWYSGSCNDITETSVVWVNNGTNCPPQLTAGNYGFLFTKLINNDYIEQEFSDGNTNNKYTRSKIAGTWGSWERILTPKSYEYKYDSISRNNTASSWQYVYGTNTQVTLEPGNYRVLMAATLYPTASSSTTQLASIRALVDGNEAVGSSRATVPLLQQLFSTVQVQFFLTTSSNAAHTFNAQSYSSVGVTIQSYYIYIERVG